MDQWLLRLKKPLRCVVTGAMFGDREIRPKWLGQDQVLMNAPNNGVINVLKGSPQVVSFRPEARFGVWRAIRAPVPFSSRPPKASPDSILG